MERFLRGLLHGVTPADPDTFAAVAMLLTLVAVLASACRPGGPRASIPSSR